MKRLAPVLALCLVLGPANARADVDLWPLLEITDDSTTVLYPFYVREGPFLMIFPFYYRTNEGKDHHLLWPFMKFSEGRLERMAPVWFAPQEGEFTLFPIIRQTRDYTLFSVPPVYLRRDGRFRAAFPLFWRSTTDEADTIVTLPGYYRRRESDGRRVDMLWPLTRWDRGGKHDRLNVAWRLFGWDRTPELEKSFVAYLYQRERGPDRWSHLVFPIFSAYREQNRSGFYLFPYYSKRGPHLSLTGIFPLWEQQTAGDARSLWLLPYYGYRSPHKTQTFVLPFFLHTTETRGDPTLVTRESLSILWPLYSRTERRAADGRLVERSRRFGFFSDSLDESGTRIFRILGIPVIERTPGPEAARGND